MDSSQLMVITALLVIGGIIFIFTKVRKQKEADSSKTVSPLKQGTYVMDMVHNISSYVAEVHRRNGRIDITLMTGHVIPYQEEYFKLMNMESVLLGEPAMFVYGADSSYIKSGEFIKKIKKVEQDNLRQKARTKYDLLRELDNIKSILKRVGGREE